MARVPPVFPAPPGTVSFTRKPIGGQTLDALMARQKELAARQAALGSQAYPGQGTIAGGLGNMVNQFTTGLGEYRAREEEALGREELTKAVAGIDQATGMPNPDQLATIMSRSPDLGELFLKGAMDARAAAAKAESWVDIATPEGEQGAWQKNSRTGELKKIGGASGQTINNVIGAGDKKWNETGAAKFGERVDAYAGEGVAAQQQLAQIDQLQFLMQDMPTGLDAKAIDYLRKNWGISLGEGADKLQAFEAIVAKMVPSQRPAGSGPMSDKDIELFRASLPSYLNDPNGNAMILASMKGMAEYNAKLGAIADQALEIPDIAEARRFFTDAVSKLEDPLVAWRKAEEDRSKASTGGTTSPGVVTVPPSATSGGGTVEDMPDGSKRITLQDGTVVIQKPKAAP